MPSQVMGTKMNTDQSASLAHDNPGGVVADRKKTLFQSCSRIFHVFLEAISHFLGNEHNLGLLAALGTRQSDLPVLNIHWSDFQNLTDPHSTSGHQLQHDPVPRLHGSENNLIDQVLLNDFPLLGRAFTEHFAQHGRIAGILDARIDRILEKVEEGLETGITVALGSWF